MSASDSPPQTAAGHASLGAALGDRNTWLLFVLGFGAGIPAGWNWVALFPRADIVVNRSLFLALTSFGVVVLLQLLAAPFLDRHRAPLFRGFGHRRSWVATAAAAALVLIGVHIAVALASEAAAKRYAAVAGVLAVPAMALLWISIDALRIEALRGRAQAAAYAAQFAGALAGAWLVGRFAGDEMSLPVALSFAALMALALAAVAMIEEPPPFAAARAADAPNSVPATLARPWRTFFARHGAAAGPLLAAIAVYALAAGAADFLGQEGHLIDILAAGRFEFDLGTVRAAEAMATQETVLLLVGAAAGLLIAFRLAPARAFVALTCAWLAVVALFLLCKAQIGFTVFTVAGLFALRTLVAGAAYVMFWTMAARLTARPDTAGQFAVLGFLLALFWISQGAFRMLAPLLGSYGIAAAAAVAAIAAILLMRAAARAARRGAGTAAAIDPA